MGSNPSFDIQLVLQSVLSDQQGHRYIDQLNLIVCHQFSVKQLTSTEILEILKRIILNYTLREIYYNNY